MFKEAFTQLSFIPARSARTTQSAHCMRAQRNPGRCVAPAAWSAYEGCARLPRGAARPAARSGCPRGVWWVLWRPVRGERRVGWLRGAILTSATLFVRASCAPRLAQAALGDAARERAWLESNPLAGAAGAGDAAAHEAALRSLQAAVEGADFQLHELSAALATARGDPQRFKLDGGEIQARQVRGGGRGLLVPTGPSSEVRRATGRRT